MTLRRNRFETAEDDFEEQRRDLSVKRRRSEEFTGMMQTFSQNPGETRQRTDKHFDENEPEGIDVSKSGVLAGEDFGCQIGTVGSRSSSGDLLMCFVEAGQTDVAQFGHLTTEDHDIGRLEVPMDDVSLVQKAQTLDELQSESTCLAHW